MDTILEGGLVFDGLGRPPVIQDVGLAGGRVIAMGQGLPRGPETRVVDARGLWVTPGFIDLHTHYDAELELAPSLSESLRHGITSVVLGSCSLSLATGTPEDLADMFCRVEAVPYDLVRKLLEERKDWEGLGAYLEHLDGLPLGPNVASFIGHSALRAKVMGLERSVTRGVHPSADELEAMRRAVEEGLDAGYLGLSIQTLPWDKMGGDRAFRSRPLPSTYARWSEYRHLHRVLRERGRVLQGVPNISTKINVALFLLESVGLWRKPLKTTIISMMDTRANRGIHRLIGVLSRIVNRVLGADFRWQALPEIFDLWADGMDLVVFEEFGAGTAALHLQDPEARSKLLNDPAYRKRFRSQWTSRWLPKVFHRDFNQSRILACPEPELVGRSFVDVARERGQHPVDTFLDLVALHGEKLRWYTVMANDRRAALDEIIQHPDVLIGFSDAGAHLRQMAHYNFPLRLLHRVRQAELNGAPVLTPERAVHRVTGELAQWLGMDAGTLEVGKRADVVLVDPEGLDDAVEQIHEAPMENFSGLVRLVRRNPRAVRGVWVNGRRAVQDGEVLPEVGKERGFGRVLAGEGLGRTHGTQDAGGREGAHRGRSALAVHADRERLRRVRWRERPARPGTGWPTPCSWKGAARASRSAARSRESRCVCRNRTERGREEGRPARQARRSCEGASEAARSMDSSMCRSMQWRWGVPESCASSARRTWRTPTRPPCFNARVSRCCSAFTSTGTKGCARPGPSRAKAGASAMGTNSSHIRGIPAS